jgi:RES domain-containing protein
LTPEDRLLDPNIFLTNRPLTLYRLARAKYANLSGVGAAQYPGRWNQFGEEAIYTSTKASLALAERLAHTPKDLIPSNLALMKIRVSGRWESHENALIDRDTSGGISILPTLAAAKSAFSSGSTVLRFGFNPFAVAVPSVIVPEWNVVLYPQGVGFWEHVTLESVEPFEFDPRLFPDNTPIEPRE